MGKSVNKVILLGNVGKDPEVRSTPSGVPVATLSIATSDRVKGEDGNYTDRTEWHSLVAFKRQAEIIRDYVRKGVKIYIEGKLQTRSWDDKRTGDKRYKTEIVVNEISLISSTPGEKNYVRDEYSQVAPAQSAEITDDDIPF